MTLEGDDLVLRKPKEVVRERWANGAKQIAQSKEDEFVLGDFSNCTDEDWVW